MQLDDETIAIQLHEMLTRHGVQLSPYYHEKSATTRLDISRVRLLSANS